MQPVAAARSHELRPNPSLEADLQQLGLRAAQGYRRTSQAKPFPARSAQTLGRTTAPHFDHYLRMAKPPPNSLPPEVLAALERGKPIEAIKLLIGLRANSMAARESPTKRAPAAAPTKSTSSTQAPAEPTAPRSGMSPGEVPRSSSAFWGWVVAALVAYLAYRLARG